MKKGFKVKIRIYNFNKGGEYKCLIKKFKTRPMIPLEKNGLLKNN